MSAVRDGHVRKLTAGVALVIAAPLSVISWALVPASMVEGDKFVEDLRTVEGSTLVASLVTGSLSLPVAVLGVMGLMHLLHTRPTLVGTAGGGLAIFGLALNTMALGAAGTLAEAARSDIEQGQSAALVETTIGGATGVLILAGPLLAALGTTMLGGALFAVRSVPRLPAVMLICYGPVQAAGFGAELVPVIITSYVMMALAMVPIGGLILWGTLEDWDTPATFGWLRKSGGDLAITVS